ncbi:hypothetical protein AAG570_009844 [Ranatra chinensis]|uniref:HSac2 domain-containing protein n=1 Tax=Ranatra chinensis TaxID=642074 RepID=A0ABD0YQE3_9HEMI
MYIFANEYILCNTWLFNLQYTVLVQFSISDSFWDHNTSHLYLYVSYSIIVCTLLTARPNTLAVVPWSGENARDFFSYRDGLVNSAVQECLKGIITAEDGDLVGHWLLTEISFWDHEKERLVLLTSKSLLVVKYDFIALKELDHKKVPLDIIDSVIIGDLSYPSSSLIPHLDGLANGVSGVVKDCLVRPIQERLSGMPSCNSANPFRISNFEASKMSGVRALWNRGAPLPFIKKWNPFEKEIPFVTFASHPLLWHKDGTDAERSIYNVDDFTSHLTSSLEWRQRNFQVAVQHRPILLENYIGLSSLIHNKNSLGFFKVRGKFSF